MNWTIGRRLTAVGALSIIAAVAVGVIGFTQATSSARDATHAFVVGSTLSAVIDTQHTASVVLADASILLNPLADDRHSEVIAQLTEHAGELHEQLGALQPDVGLGAEFAAHMTAFIATINPVLDDAAALARTSGPVSQDTFDRVQQHWDDFDQRSDAVKSALSGAAARNVSAADSSARRTKIVIVMATVLSALVVGAITVLVARVIATPIRTTKQLLERVAGGDFTGRLTVRSGDDLGQMATAVNDTVDRVGQALHQISQEAAALSGAAQHLSGVSRQVATDAAQVATEAQAASGSAAQVGDDVQGIAHGTGQMHTSINEIARNAEAASAVVATAVSAAEGANITVTKLAASTDQIGQVAKVIAAIAEQTNLLALNATIEAARAGELGKGFAVVAGEVKDLARETATATEDIARQIASLQADGSAASAVIDGIAGTINQIADIQQRISVAVGTQSAATRDITDRAGRAADRTTDIATRVAAVTSTSQQATTTAAQTQRAAQDLATTAMNLQSIVTRFQLTS
ncbi:HAMP domain-containing protein [Dactylosporangium vinaceum]|uniref:Methyl-accepting chemotaxis protein n=1 Tax=Dactylosporangium vinaceum TaxID=53362 RepID=A0ABV5MQU8_9ACTN|nr:methyl-accepting chemotaxis protein [Dactylosporangium vinaceum]UAB93857.1 HAMP domain-containing protein [Dactylosporangium vinaceum]